MSEQEAIEVEEQANEEQANVAETKPEEKRELSFNELMEQANNPYVLQAMAEKMGLQVVNPNAIKPVQDEAVPSIPQLEIPEDADPDMVRQIKETNKVLSQAVPDYINQVVQKQISAIEEKRQSEAKAQEAAKINEFIESKGREKVAKVIDVMEPLYQKTGDLEKAYDWAVKAMGLEEAKPKKETKTTETDEGAAARKITSIKSSDQIGSPSQSELQGKAVDYRQAARLSLKEAYEAAGSGPDIFRED